RTEDGGRRTEEKKKSSPTPLLLSFVLILRPPPSVLRPSDQVFPTLSASSRAPTERMPMVGLPPVTLLTLSGALLTGLILALLGNLKLALAQRTELTEGRIGWLFATLNVILVGFLLAAGVLVDYWGIRPMMITGSVVLALALLALTADLSYGRILWVVVLAA